MQSPQEATSHPVKNTGFILLTQAMTTAEKAAPQGRVLLCCSSGLLRDKTKRSQFQGAACASRLITPHAPAIASCRAGPVSHNTRQASWDAGVATSLNPSRSKASTTKLSEQKRDKSLRLEGDPFCITHQEFASVVQPLKEQSPTDPCQRQPLPQHLL